MRAINLLHTRTGERTLEISVNFARSFYGSNVVYLNLGRNAHVDNGAKGHIAGQSVLKSDISGCVYLDTASADCRGEEEQLIWREEFQVSVF